MNLDLILRAMRAQKTAHELHSQRTTDLATTQQQLSQLEARDAWFREKGAVSDVASALPDARASLPAVQTAAEDASKASAEMDANLRKQCLRLAAEMFPKLFAAWDQARAKRVENSARGENCRREIETLEERGKSGAISEGELQALGTLRIKSDLLRDFDSRCAAEEQAAETALKSAIAEIGQAERSKQTTVARSIKDVVLEILVEELEIESPAEVDRLLAQSKVISRVEYAGASAAAPSGETTEDFLVSFVCALATCAETNVAAQKAIGRFVPTTAATSKAA